MKQFTAVEDVKNIGHLVTQAKRYKENPLADETLGNGKRMALLFLNPSLRTRMSTQIAAENLGMRTIVLNADKDGWKLEFEERAIMNGTAVEHIKDAAPILGAYCDILAVRSFPLLQNRGDDYAEQIINQFIKYASVPVVSLESSTLHPLQSLADILTIEENLAKENQQPKIVLTWAPHVKALPQCVANSFAQWVNAWNEERETKADFVIAHPAGFELAESFTKGATILHNQDEALKDADIIYVKNWSALEPYGKLYEGAEDWMLSNKKLSAAPGAKLMHCLPVRRNVELADEVLDGSSSIVTQQAANRVWAAQAAIAEILKSLP